MIAGTTASPAAAYRVGHEQRASDPVTRRTWNRTWLVVALIVLGLALAREARSFGPIGLLAPILIVVVTVIIVGAIAPSWLRRSPPSAAPPAPRDVTPREAADASSSIAARPGPAPVVIIERPTAVGERPEATLASKLATLDRLRDDGRLTDTEYEAKRAQLIADF
jgi:hypothetical protein